MIMETASLLPPTPQNESSLSSLLLCLKLKRGAKREGSIGLMNGP